MSGKVWFIIGVVFFVVFIGIVASGIGVSSEPDYAIDAPDDLSTWEMIWNGMVFFVDLLTFRVEGVLAEVNLMFVVPFLGGLLYIIVRLARGGG